LIKQISKIKIRSGLKENLPVLDKGELGWAVDTQQLYIGNGTTDDGAPVAGNTEILTTASSNNGSLTLLPSAGSLSGTQDGVNRIFTIPVVPYTNTLTIWCNFPLVPGVGYQLSGSTVTFTNAPVATDTLHYQCWYKV